MSDSDIGAVYGVSHTTIHYWIYGRRSKDAKYKRPYPRSGQCEICKSVDYNGKTSWLKHHSLSLVDPLVGLWLCPKCTLIARLCDNSFTQIVEYETLKTSTISFWRLDEKGY